MIIPLGVIGRLYPVIVPLGAIGRLYYVIMPLCVMGRLYLVFMPLGVIGRLYPVIMLLGAIGRLYPVIMPLGVIGRLYPVIMPFGVIDRLYPVSIALLGHLLHHSNMSCKLKKKQQKKRTFGFVRLAKILISMRIRAVCSESSLSVILENRKSSCGQRRRWAHMSDGTCHHVTAHMLQSLYYKH